MVFDDPRAIGRVFNIGAGVETSILELARRVVEHAGSDSEIVLVPYSEAYDEGFEELGKRKPDASLVHALTGWEPHRTVDDAIVDVIAYERARLRAESSVLGRDLGG
jgi:UDP-glucose 4-epimerase